MRRTLHIHYSLATVVRDVHTELGLHVAWVNCASVALNDAVAKAADCRR